VRGALTVKVKPYATLFRSPLPVTVMVAGPVGVLAEVVRVRVVEHVGVQEVLEKEALAPAGSPDAEKVTACEVPETRVAVMVFVTDEPWVTDRSPPFASEKSKVGCPHSAGSSEISYILPSFAVGSVLLSTPRSTI